MSYAVDDRTSLSGGEVSIQVPTLDREEFFGEIDQNGRPLPVDAVAEMLHDVQDFTGRYSTAKRILDIAGSLVGMVVFGPVTLLAMLAVFLHDRRNPIFCQTRVGQGGRRFTIFKIRTMCVDAEARFEDIKHLNKHDDDRTFKMDQDPRILPYIGCWLRKFSVDEFPQLVNVLIGDMSLVGPRPALPKEVDQYSGSDKLRLTVKPGLTCFWQVSGRGDIAFREQLALDLRYIDECSLKTDLTLIAKTFPALLTANGAK